MKILKNNYLSLLLLLLLNIPAFGQSIIDYRLNKQFQLYKSSALLGNSVTDLRINNNTIWIGTGKGLNSTSDNGTTIIEYTVDDIDIGAGGVSALAVMGDIILSATAFDDPDVDESNATGSGLTLSLDNGFTWTHIDQPKDNDDALTEIIFGDTIDALPTVIDIDNVTFDIAITEDSIVYITSFAGGAKKSTDLGATWSRIVLPPDDQDSLTAFSDHNFDLSPVNNTNFNVEGNLNHRPFSVIAWGETVFIGTAGGINRSNDGGVNWFKSGTGNSDISGSWAVAMHRHVWKGEETILAATRPTITGEFLAVSISKDGGVTWRPVLQDERVWNFASFDSVIYAAADSGLFKSIDGGFTWASFPRVIDKTLGSPLFTKTFFSALGADDNILWAGSADGLIYSDDFGSSWSVIRSVQQIESSSEIKTYSYPNPFSPARHNTFGGEGHVRFHYTLSEASTVSISIFDFSMTLVADAAKDVSRSAGEWDEVWNGRNGFGNIVANGTYFYKLTIDKNSGGKESYWGKVMLIE